jgi:predicted anti-sigma-YlaC factor YlaD
MDITCEEMSLNVMALLDGELDDTKISQVKEHLESCNTCSEHYASIKKVKEVTSKMKFKKLPEFYWDDYWKHIYNRIERGLSWLLLSLGAIIVLCFAGWELLDSLVSNNEMNPLLKAGIFILATGLIILIISILREKLMVRRVDKYREVER